MKSTINLGYLVFLSVVAALGGFLFGYDTAVISGTIAQVTEQFGLDALQQGWYVGCALIGSIIYYDPFSYFILYIGYWLCCIYRL